MAKIVHFDKERRAQIVNNGMYFTFTIPRHDRYFWLQFVSFVGIAHGIILNDMFKNGKLKETDYYAAMTLSVFIQVLSHIQEGIEEQQEGDAKLTLQTCEIPVVMMGLTYFSSAGKMIVNGDYSSKQYEKKSSHYVRLIDDESKYFVNEPYFIEQFHYHVESTMRGIDVCSR